MSAENKKLYIAGMGMITPVGGNVAMTAASVEGGISAYRLSSYLTEQGEVITMARVPDQVFAEFNGNIDEGDRFNPRHDRVVKMAILALQEACSKHTGEQAMPLLLAMPDIKTDDEGLSSLVENLTTNFKPWISPALTRSLYSGRVSGIEAIDFAFRHLCDGKYPYILVGGSDCHEDGSRLMPLDAAERLLTETSADAFAPGEAASFILLTPHIELAQKHEGNVVALLQPGFADESGHLFSDEPYRGDGLDQAFKAALASQVEHSIHSIYSSMNGENHWAKEYGVAFTRNRNIFKEPVCIEHPADCYGDLGSATATALITLAATNLFKNKQAQTHLVYSSSDTAKRGAIVVTKIAVEAAAARADNSQHIRDS